MTDPWMLAIIIIIILTTVRDCPQYIHMLKPNLQCDSIWRWGCWEELGLDEIMRMALSEWD